MAIDAKENKCKMHLLETYGIISYTEPIKENLVICPTISSSCCPAYE